MDKIEALDNIKNIWNQKNISLAEKVYKISNDFYSANLNLMSTAAYIKATPSELDALLSLSELDDDIIEKISTINPPKTTWIMLANANCDELDEALAVMKSKKNSKVLYSELVYKSMIDISGPTPQQKANSLTATEIKNIRMKAEQYKILSEKDIKFLKSIASQKGRGKSLTEKQIAWVISILERLVEGNVFTRNSMDDDQDLCDKVLEILGK